MMMSRVYCRVSNGDKLLDRLCEVEVDKKVRLNEVKDLVDNHDGRFTGKEISGAGRASVAAEKNVARGRATSEESVVGRGVCENRAPATKGLRDQEDQGGGSQHSNLHKHQNAFGVPIMAEDKHPVTLLHMTRG